MYAPVASASSKNLICSFVRDLSQNLPRAKVSIDVGIKTHKANCGCLGKCRNSYSVLVASIACAVILVAAVAVSIVLASCVVASSIGITLIEVSVVC